jgi:hypothetical protein
MVNKFPNLFSEIEEKFRAHKIPAPYDLLSQLKPLNTLIPHGAYSLHGAGYSFKS